MRFRNRDETAEKRPDPRLSMKNSSEWKILSVSEHVEPEISTIGRTK